MNFLDEHGQPFLVTFINNKKCWVVPDLFSLPETAEVVDPKCRGEVLSCHEKGTSEPTAYIYASQMLVVWTEEFNILIEWIGPASPFLPVIQYCGDTYVKLYGPSEKPLNKEKVLESALQAIQVMLN